MPFYDPERSLIFLAGKGDTNIKYLEFNTETSALTFSKFSSKRWHFAQI